MTVFQSMSHEDMLAELMRLREANEKLRKANQAKGKLTLKVSEKKAVSVYGLGRFPVTLYRGQMLRLLDAAVAIREFIEANSEDLADKE